jgi:hypothetical protein
MAAPDPVSLRQLAGPVKAAPSGRPSAGFDWPSSARPTVEVASRSSRGSALRHQADRPRPALTRG